MFILENGLPSYQTTQRQSRLFNPNIQGWKCPEIPLEPDEKISKIKTLLLELDISSQNNYQREMKDIKILVRNYSSDVSHLKNIIQNLYSFSLDNIRFSQNYALLCGELANFEVSGLKVRDEVLKLLQISFEDTSMTKQKRMNFYALLGEIFSKMKISDGSPIKVLALPIINNMRDILTNNQNHIYLFTLQMATIGILLKEIEPEEFVNLLIDMRRYLIKAEFNSPSKVWLLIAFDICDNCFKGLTEEKKNFYEQVINRKTLNLLKPVDLYSSTDIQNKYSKNEEPMNSNQLNANNNTFSSDFINTEKPIQKRGRSILGKGEYAKNKQ